MSKLPAGWGRIKLGEVANFTNGKAFKREEWRDSGTPIIRIQNLTTRSKNFNYADDSHEPKYRVGHSDLLVSWSATLGVYYWWGDVAWLNQHIFKVDRFRGCDKRYLKYAIQASISEFYGKTHGMGMVHITKGDFESHLIPLPPLAEQKRIAQKLDALLAQVDTLKGRIDAILPLLKRFRNSVMVAASAGKLSAGWRTENHFGDWSEVSFGELLVDSKTGICRGPFGSAIKKEYFVSAGYKVYEQKNAIKDSAALGEYFIDEEKFLELKRFSVQPGDFIVSCAGTVGRISQLPKQAAPGVINQALMRVRTDQRKIADKYFLLLFTSPMMQEMIISGARGGAMQNMASVKEIKALKVRTPPLEEQAEIVRRVEQLFAFADQLEARISAAQKRIGALTQSLLAKAFRGELVPQDPNDEPASALLERIRANRAAPPKPRRGRKGAAN